MSLRLRRLANEARMLQEQFGGHAHVSVVPSGGDPPDRYRVMYRLSGLERRADGALVVRREHEMEIVLPAEYPRQPAACRMLTPVFHPNIDTFTVCTSDFHAAQETLADLIVRVGQMIAFQKHNVKSPLNAEAAMWVEQNLARLPVDRVDLYPASQSPASGLASVQRVSIQAPAPPSAPPAPPLAPQVPVPPTLRTEPMPPPPVAPIVSAPPTASSEEAVDLDRLTIQLIAPLDFSVPVEGVRVAIGETVRIGSTRCMVTYRDRPAGLELRPLSGQDVLEIGLQPDVDLDVGPVRLRVRGADLTSLARISARAASHADQVVFWNGVVASQIALAPRLERLLEATPRTAPNFQETIAAVQEKLGHFQRLATSSAASAHWKDRLASIRERLEQALRLAQGSPHA